MKSYPTVGILFFFALIILVTPLGINFPADNQAQAQVNSQNRMEGKKTGGIVGDPSHKRGFDLGYDAGPRAGNEDKLQNKTQDYSRRPEYLKPEQFYCYEYGSRAMFVAGYRRGFLRGYNSSFAPYPRKTLIEPTAAREPRIKKNTLAKESTLAGDAW